MKLTAETHRKQMS